jgi:hypothetical protein
MFCHGYRGNVLNHNSNLNQKAGNFFLKFMKIVQGGYPDNYREAHFFLIK